MSQAMHQGEVHRADPGRRRLLLRVLVVLLLAGAACLYLLYSWLSQGLVGIPVEDAIMLRRSKWILLADLWLLLGICAGLGSAIVLQLAKATRKERRWPPAGARTATDMRIRYLSSADQVARRLRGAGLAIGAIAVASAIAGVFGLARLFW